MRNFILLILIFFLIGSLYARENITSNNQNWPQWRGPLSTGVSPKGNPPIEWAEDKNVKWKIEIPGRGHATPIVWDNQIFILTAIETDKAAEGQESHGQEGGQSEPGGIKTDKVHMFNVLSIDRHTGKVIWQRTVREEYPADGTHELGSWASHSPVTDGEYVYTYFGSHGLFCLDMQGNLKWDRDFGDMQKARSFGEGSSPVLYKDKIIIVWDHEGQSFIFAVDKNSGKDVWKVERDEVSSWATPLIVEYAGQTQVITCATNRIRSYDPDTGKLLWECTGMTRNVIPSPLYANGIVYAVSGFRGSALLALDLSKAKGDITDSDAILWKYEQDTPYTPSPLLYDDLFYMLRVNKGYLTCLNAKTGDVIYSAEKLDQAGDVFSSLVGAQNRIYVTGINGTMYVVKHGPKFEILAQNKLDDGFEASPAIIGNDIYLRGFKHLYCISQQ